MGFVKKPLILHHMRLFFGCEGWEVQVFEFRRARM